MHPVALVLHPGALCERGTHIPAAHGETEAHSSQSVAGAGPSGRTQRRPLPGSRTWPWILISGGTYFPLGASGPSTAPETVGKHQGKGSPPRPRTGHSPVTRPHVTVASGPANISHCPLDGEVLWAAGAEGGGASCPHHADRPGKDERKPLWAARGPSQTSDPPPGHSKLGLPHGCCKYHCAKMQQAQSRETKPRSPLERNAGPSLSGCILLE